MKSVIYEFDPVIYPFKLLVSKNYDSKVKAKKKDESFSLFK